MTLQNNSDATSFIKGFEPTDTVELTYEKNLVYSVFECPLIWHLPFGSIHTGATTVNFSPMSPKLLLTYPHSHRKEDQRIGTTIFVIGFVNNLSPINEKSLST